MVYRGEWAGTAVAVKVIKIRNANCIKPVFESKVKVHSMVRYPNIVQIMAVSFLKNSITSISSKVLLSVWPASIIKGSNLDSSIFPDTLLSQNNKQGKLVLTKKIKWLFANAIVPWGRTNVLIAALGCCCCCCCCYFKKLK